MVLVLVLVLHNGPRRPSDMCDNDDSFYAIDWQCMKHVLNTLHATQRR